MWSADWQRLPEWISACFADCRGNSLHLWDSPDADGPALYHLRMLNAPKPRV